MEKEQMEYAVEFEDTNGVVYFENIQAASIEEARSHIQNGRPDVTIRAVTLVEAEER